MTETPYIPINCSLYDQLEAFAVQRTMVDITFEESSKLIALSQVVFRNFETKNNGEFAELIINEATVMVRLDYIKTLNGLAVKDEFGGSCSMQNTP